MWTRALRLALHERGPGWSEESGQERYALHFTNTDLVGIDRLQFDVARLLAVAMVSGLQQLQPAWTRVLAFWLSATSSRRNTWSSHLSEYARR